MARLFLLRNAAGAILWAATFGFAGLLLSGSSCSSCITLLPELSSSWPLRVSSALATSFIAMSID